jgi:hypothetical protein
MPVLTLIVIFWLGERLFRGVFGPERDEVTGGSRKLHNEVFIICTLLQV